MSKHPFDSYAPLLLELNFEIEPGKFEAIPAYDYLQSFEVTITSESAWSGTINLFDHEGSYLEALVIATGISRKVQLRWGWDAGRGLTGCPTYEGTTTVYTPSFTHEGVGIQMDLIGTPVVAQFNKEVEPRSFKAGLTCTEIFELIANKWGWETETEPSQGTMDELQMGEKSVLKFIKEDLLPLAASAAAGERFLFYIDRAGVVHFHSARRVDKLGAVYTFARATMGDVISFAPSDQSFFGKLWGAGKSVFSAADSAGGTKLEDITSEERGVSSIPNIGEPDSAHFRKHLDGAMARVSFLSRDPEEFKRRLAARYQRLAAQAYSAALEVRGTHAVMPPDFVTVNYHRHDGSLHYLSGTFRAFEVTHNFDSSGWKTSMTLQRGGTKQAEGLDKRTHTRQRTAEQDVQTQDVSQEAVTTAEGKGVGGRTITKRPRNG